MSRALSAAIVLAAGAVWAHPLGNFTTNRQARIEIAPDALRVRYVVDLAELPTYLTIAAIDADGDGLADTTELRAWAAGLARDVARNLHVAVDGRDAALRPARAEAFLLAGAGGLPTLRAELDLDAPLAASRGTIVVHDDDFAGLPGWQEIVAAATDDVALGETTAATVDRTDELRSYPSDALAVPPQSREARIAFAPGRAAPAATTPASALRSGAARFGDHLTALVADRTPLSFPMVLSALAIAAMLYARGLFDRLPVDGRVARYAPVANAAIISLAGLAIVVEALVEIGA